jgi:hypothetical protein
MYSLKPVLFALLVATTYAQESAPRPVVLPDLPPPPKIKAVVQQQPTSPAPNGPFTVKPRTDFAVFQNTVYFKVGDMVVPMIGTSGCFTPKELLKAGDVRLQFGDEPPAPPPPPPNR